MMSGMASNPMRGGQSGVAAGRYYIERSGKWRAADDDLDNILEEARSIAEDESSTRPITVSVWENLYPGRRKILSIRSSPSRGVANPTLGFGLPALAILGLIGYGFWESRR